MPERDLVSGIVQLANVLTRRLAPVFQRAGVTPQQWSVLSLLGGTEGGPSTLAAISRSLRVSKQNMTGMIARLEQLGLVERAGDPNDLRSSRVQLTRRGRSLVDRNRAAYEEWLSQIGGGAISDRDLQSLSKTVDKLIDAIESADTSS
jgi:DNA-binding MarR family transcriptional regulator